MTDKTVLFMLHALGGSARAWEGVTAALGTDFEAVPIDLPGFGEASNESSDSDFTVEGMADHVATIVRAHAPARWLLVGHSMGGKIASVVAARTLGGEPGLFGLAGVVLLAGSPPSPEPMEESRRQDMMAWAANGPLDAAAVRAFIDGNVGSALPPQADSLAIADLQRASPRAWLAWLERGSREDWTKQVGTLDLPALIIVGGADGDLGEAGQRKTNALVYPRARIVVEEGAAHLLTLERPKEVAGHIARFCRAVANAAPRVPEAYVRVIASDRVSRRMRAALAGRALADPGDYTPSALSVAQLTTLRAVADCVVPQSGVPIDLAARIDAQLSAGKGDGWRFSDLPADKEAYALALDGLSGFAALSASGQQTRLTHLIEGQLGTAALSAEQMKHWFEDLRADLVRNWVAHPATMARIGFDGFANGGDGTRKQGFERLAADEHEAWEPLREVAR